MCHGQAQLGSSRLEFPSWGWGRASPWTCPLQPLPCHVQAGSLQYSDMPRLFRALPAPPAELFEELVIALALRPLTSVHLPACGHFDRGPLEVGAHPVHELDAGWPSLLEPVERPAADRAGRNPRFAVALGKRSFGTGQVGSQICSPLGVGFFVSCRASAYTASGRYPPPASENPPPPASCRATSAAGWASSVVAGLRVIMP
mmetsp:Transcript_34848/g.137604  ORF Transcript_34848/g.137604 Transcript_34848/m.137604 type:complete len:202 (-) Transcript_34848:203-808(-)